ncbi:MAG: tRNA (adenosine(37)-N6)-threonylcarbamoyltransferase complex dimerization subunit type 1 TsaB [Solirubrobacteraceae bacterium]
MLVIDTATQSTVVGVRVGDSVVERRHDPEPGERPGHVSQVLGLAEEALAAAGIELSSVDRIGVGVGPGSFTGLRIGIATARALAHSTGLELAPVSTLGALAVAAGDGPVLAVLDARRGEAFVALWEGGRGISAPRALAPEHLRSAAAGARLAVGDGALRFREQLESAGVSVPADDSPLHRVGAAGLVRLAQGAPVVARDALLPEYVRSPDAKPRSER